MFLCRASFVPTDILYLFHEREICPCYYLHMHTYFACLKLFSHDMYLCVCLLDVLLTERGRLPVSREVCSVF